MPQYPYGPVNTNLGEVLALSAASVSGASAVLINAQGRGITVFLDVTSITGSSAEIATSIVAVDPTTSATVSLLAGPTVSAAGEHMMQVYPGIATVSGAAANAVVPQQWQIAYTISGTTPAVTASFSAVVQI